MKIAVTSTGQTLDDPVSAELHLSEYFLIIDFETSECESIISPAELDGGSDANELLVHELLRAGVFKVLVGHLDPSVVKSFSESLEGKGVQIVDGMTGSVRSAIRQFTEISMAETTVIPCEEILN
jgi:predicted Fe-Mo cluster-binding NifX family protein